MWDQIKEVGKTILKEKDINIKVKKVNQCSPSIFLKNMLQKEDTIYPDQDKILSYLGNHVDLQYSHIYENIEKPEQMLLLIHAGPGCGKTWVVRKMVELLQE